MVTPKRTAAIEGGREVMFRCVVEVMIDDFSGEQADGVAAIGCPEPAGSCRGQGHTVPEGIQNP